MLEKTMKYSIAVLAAATLATSASAAVLSVNLGKSTAPAEAGFTTWEADDNQGAISPGISTTISGIDLSIANVFNQAGDDDIRSILRNAHADYITNNPGAEGLPSLTRSWWGTRQNATAGFGGFDLVIDGVDLGAGDFNFTSWHHDQGNLSGTMDIFVSTDGGTSFTQQFDGFAYEDGGDALGPNPATFSFISDGVNDVVVRIRTDGSSAFVATNGFKIEVPEPGSLALLGLGGLLVARRRRG